MNFVYVGDDERDYPTLGLGGPAEPGQTYDIDSSTEPNDGRWADPDSDEAKAAVAAKTARDQATSDDADGAKKPTRTRRTAAKHPDKTDTPTGDDQKES